MAKPYDASTKFLFDHYLADWLPLAGRPGVAAGALDADLSGVTAACDKLLRVAAPLSDWLYHLELQTSPDPLLARRIHLYNTLAEYKHGLNVQSVVMLLRRAAGRPRLSGVYRSAFPGERAHRTFRFKVVRVWQQPAEQWLSGGLGLVPLAPLADDAVDRLPDVIRRMGQRFEAEAAPADAAELWSASKILMGLRYPKSVTWPLVQGVRGMRESSTYQAILEEGRLEQSQRLLLLLGRSYCGKASAAIQAVIAGLSDLERLERMIQQAPKATSWTDLLATP